MDNEENRLSLHTLLTDTFPDVTIYYRPPGNVLLQYPCVVYEPKAFLPSYANAAAYVVGNRYQVTFISVLPGVSNSQLMFVLHGHGLVVESNTAFENDDLAHEVFTVSVNSL